MAVARDMRRCAVQALYQFDAGGADDPDRVRATLAASPGTDRSRSEGFKLAVSAWKSREQADADLAPFTPDWPTHRQPIIDRSILRLAWHEIVEAGTPPKVVINEAVELAREFSTDKSPLFINGVLDRFYKGRMPNADADAEAAENEGASELHHRAEDDAGAETEAGEVESAAPEHEHHQPPGSY